MIVRILIKQLTKLACFNLEKNDNKYLSNNKDMISSLLEQHIDENPLRANINNRMNSEVMVFQIQVLASLKLILILL